MKKIIKGLISIGLCGILALGAAGCRPGNTNGSAHRDPEKDPLKLAIGATDRKFNPLLYTSQNDGTIANLTQASLLTADNQGKLAYGDDYPTVALDYKETYYSDIEGTNEIGSGDGRNEIKGTSSVNGSTSYEFVIKNGVKFSDGVDLTVMDVLFNLYAYLDPVYTGSSTIYSTKIIGLSQYRSQDPNAEEGSTENTAEYYSRANQRIQALIDWSEQNGEIDGDWENADLKEVQELYKEELESDWNTVETGWREAYKEYRFTEEWQVFYYMEGIVKNQTEQNEYGNVVNCFEDINGNGIKEDGEKYYTTLDPDLKDGHIEHQGLIDEMAAACSEEKINEYIAANENVSRENAKLALQKKAAVDYVYTANAENRTQISFILKYCATASTAFDFFMRDERAKDVPAGGLTVPRISGITVSRASTFNGKDLGAEHDILKIRIKGVDPKAKWNFSFAVAPMHYYSDKTRTDAAMKDYTDGNVYNGTATNFGVVYKGYLPNAAPNSNWFNDVLGEESKTRLPVGAGAYKCCHYKMDGSSVNGNTFFYNKIANYERNEYFTTLGSGIENAKIKYVTYKETPDDKIVETLKTGEIDYGTPTATANNQRALNVSPLKQVTYQTGGYGYVGINPKYVPDIEVRRAIMYAFNTAPIVEYYGQELVDLINRPMSITSWASPENPENITDQTPKPSRYYEMTDAVLDGKSDVEFIRGLVAESNNWYFDEGKGKIVSTSDGSTPLKLTFTIAGESSDHPAYSMFFEAEDLLERCGFEIAVETNIQALQKLAGGDLQVWAAAWSSSIDPDPYQIYSINSQASSTKNWYKDGIMQDATDKFEEERRIANAISELIDRGRETLNETDRINIYKQCLDLIMELAVEFPTYQRNDLCVYNSTVLDASTMHIDDASYNVGPIDELWKVGYLK